MEVKREKKVKDGSKAEPELESQFILRMPPVAASKLYETIQKDPDNLDKRFCIKLESDMRHGSIKLDDLNLSAKVYDLPTVVESCKTVDGKVFYKTADIAQIMIAKETDGAINEDEIFNDEGDQKFTMQHGITPPMKNVRKRRFRKTLKRHTNDIPALENEVKRLFRADANATRVHYELIDEEDEKISSFDETGRDSLLDTSLTDSEWAKLVDDNAECNIFGSILSSSEDSDGDTESIPENQKEAMLRLRRAKIDKFMNEQEFIACISEESLESDNFAILRHKNDKIIDKQEFIPNTPGSIHDTESLDMNQLESEAAGKNLGELLREENSEFADELYGLEVDELASEINELLRVKSTREAEPIENKVLKQKFCDNVSVLNEVLVEKQGLYKTSTDKLPEEI